MLTGAGVGRRTVTSSACWIRGISVSLSHSMKGYLNQQYLANAYVSGMKEDLNFQGNQYNLLTTFFTCGYLIGQIPSQFLLTRVRPSYYIPTVELLWSIITFCFASVKNVKAVFALRFIIGMLESPFAVGVLTIMGSWYTPRGKSLIRKIF
jgi:ACS family pantothenate transporter-like MFS transporter